MTASFCDQHYDELARGYRHEDWAPDDRKYFKGPSERLDTSEPVTTYYEFHGIRVVRQVDVLRGGAAIYRSARSDGGWARVGEIPLTQIPRDDPDFPLLPSSAEEFERLWSRSVPDPRHESQDG